MCLYLCICIHRLTYSHSWAFPFECKRIRIRMGSQVFVFSFFSKKRVFNSSEPGTVYMYREQQTESSEQRAANSFNSERDRYLKAKTFKAEN